MSDFTKREREIREALFAVFYERNWKPEFRLGEPERTNPEADLERWKFVDRVIDELREQKLTK